MADLEKVGKWRENYFNNSGQEKSTEFDLSLNSKSPYLTFTQVCCNCN